MLQKTHMVGQRRSAVSHNRGYRVLSRVVTIACLALFSMTAPGPAAARQREDPREPERKRTERIEQDIRQQCAKLKKAFQLADDSLNVRTGGGRRGRELVDPVTLQRLESAREDARRKYCECLMNEYVGAGLDVPDWVEELCKEPTATEPQKPDDPPPPPAPPQPLNPPPPPPPQLPPDPCAAENERINDAYRAEDSAAFVAAYQAYCACLRRKSPEQWRELCTKEAHVGLYTEIMKMIPPSADVPGGLGPPTPREPVRAVGAVGPCPGPLNEYNQAWQAWIDGGQPKSGPLRKRLANAEKALNRCITKHRGRGATGPGTNLPPAQPPPPPPPPGPPPPGNYMPLDSASGPGPCVEERRVYQETLEGKRPSGREPLVEAHRRLCECLQGKIPPEQWAYFCSWDQQGQPPDFPPAWRVPEGLPQVPNWLHEDQTTVMVTVPPHPETDGGSCRAWPGSKIVGIKKPEGQILFSIGPVTVPCRQKDESSLACEGVDGNRRVVGEVRFPADRIEGSFDFGFPVTFGGPWLRN